MSDIALFSAALIPFSEICADLKANKSVLRRWALDQGFVFSKMRVEGRGPLVLALSKENAKALVAKRKETGFLVPRTGKDA
jgi:hypothetical protein